ncbi:recombinase family protein [Thermodesulfobacteriota bacterium]
MTTRKKKIAGYGRVSTKAQVEEGTSAEDQKNRIKNECKQTGWKLHKFYSDDGFSGKNMEFRPGIQSLIADAKENKFDTVVFTKLDRVGRNQRELHNFYYLMQEELGLKLMCLDDPALSTEGKLGRAIMGLLAMFAEFERDLIRERMEGGRAIKWKGKEAYIGAPPFCYKWNKQKKKIETVPEQVEIYERIVSMYIDQKYSFLDIANLLSDEKVPTPSVMAKKYKKGKAKRATRWNVKTISNILKNEAYKGQAVYNKYYFEVIESPKAPKRSMTASDKQKPVDQWITIDFPRLISDERWNQIQTRIDHQKIKPKKSHKDLKDKFLVANVLYCGACGARMKKVPIYVGKDKKKEPYYVCTWKTASASLLKSNGRERCNSKHWIADKVDNRIFAEIINVITKPNQFIKNWLKDMDLEEIRLKRERLREQEQDQKEKLVRAFHLITEEDDPEQRAILMDLRKKEKGLYQEITKELEKANNDFDLVENKADRLQEFENLYKKAGKSERFKLVFKTKGEFKKFLINMPFEEKKRIIEAVISPENGGKCIIRYVSPNDYLDGETLKGAPKAEIHEPLKDQDPLIEMDFRMDLNAIESVITGLNKRDLLDKFNKERIAVE